MCPIPNSFWDRAIWMYNRKIVDKKEILCVCTVSNTGINCSSDRVGAVYNKCLKIPPSTSLHFATCVKTWRALRLSASWRSFMQAITSSMLTSSSSRVSTSFCTLLTFHSSNPHKQTSNRVKSGDLGGLLMVLPRQIHLLGKVSLRCCITCRVYEKGLRRRIDIVWWQWFVVCNVHFIGWEFCRIIPLSADRSISVGALYMGALHKHFCLEWAILWPPRILTFPPGTPCI